MQNFQLHMPTRIIFGNGEVAQVGPEAAKLGRHALLVTGRGSARRTGALDRVLTSLQQAGVARTLFEGIEPNPRADTVDRAAAVAREAGCDLVVALGGGSSMDAAKAIATVAVSGRPSTDYLAGHASGHWRELLPVREALPVIAVPTLAATGSEANSGGVITDWETRTKSVISGPALFPRVAILDPELTYTVPRGYTADGCADIFTHLYEPYLTSAEGAFVQDQISEGLMRAVVRYSRVALERPDDPEARANLLWASTLALIGIAQAGRGGTFPVHSMEHTLSGHYDISHGRGLAILGPAYFRRVVLQDRPQRLARLGREVFGGGAGVTAADDPAAAEQAIAAIEAWYRDIGVYSTLRDAGIPRDALPVMAEDTIRVAGRGQDFIRATRPLKAADVLQVYEDCYA